MNHIKLFLVLFIASIISIIWAGDKAGGLNYHHGAINRGSLDKSNIHLVFTALIPL